jgi:hypothetical protein
VTFLSASDLQTERELSWGLGAGIVAFPARSVGVRLQGAYNPTRLGDSDATICDPFGFCADRLAQWQFTTGLVLRF